MPWPGDPRVNLQEGDGRKAKAYQVEQLLKASDRWRAEQSAKPTPERTTEKGAKKAKKKRR